MKEDMAKGRSRTFPTVASPERAFLVGLEVRGEDALLPVEESLAELAQLVQSAGATVVGSTWQRLERVNPATFIGQGKVEEIAARRQELGYTMVVFDDELSPSQQRNLERLLGVKVLDRSAIILDIFAQRARSREGRLQVELAQLEYNLPRLAGLWQHLERLGGGIGTRGPGETQLETDRRLVRQRIHRLQEELEEVQRHRALYRRQRKKAAIPIIALVGYTNAGKSTLFNALTGAEVAAEDRPFATLDPTARRLVLPSGQHAILLDTVGFIHKLPPTLVAAFHATLEELEEADLLVHVVDITHNRRSEQVRVVHEVLEDLGLGEKPRVLALNKVDLLPRFSAHRSQRTTVVELIAPRAEHMKSVLISAQTGWGLDQLRQALEEELKALRLRGAVALAQRYVVEAGQALGGRG
jgi:GTP-binding protein HflX